MQGYLDNIWQETQRLTRTEKFKLLEKLIRQLKMEDEIQEERLSWESIYGIGRGLWDIDAQKYVNQLREDRH